ncbi:MAG: hypothetical protein DRJ10_16165 [Bacteroidetes bacterium]|nr:MAG: hypothetical protein DRJ10_16165 [Bacteroidota bacterium]
MQTHITKYTDNTGSVNTEIINEFNEESNFCLFLDINGVKFQGSSFDDFELIDKQNYAPTQMQRFTLNKLKYHNSDEFELELCNCTLEVLIPVKIIEKRNKKELDLILNMELSLGKPKNNGGIDFENAIFSLSINNKQYKSESDMMEEGLENLQKQFDGKYAFKNCFGCLYSDYSPFGNGFFGSLQCFRDRKEEYLKASDKMEFISLADKGFISVQETYLCKDYKQRIKNTGYRG